MRYFVIICTTIIFCFEIIPQGFTIDNTWSPNTSVEVKLNLPLSHLDINNYVPSVRGIFKGIDINFDFYKQYPGWPHAELYMYVRADNDLDPTNGIEWTGWHTDQQVNHYFRMTKKFTISGKHTITTQLKLYGILGDNHYEKVKEFDIVVSPMPNSVYKDNSTSSEITPEERVAMGLSDGLVRFSIGLDNNIEL